MIVIMPPQPPSLSGPTVITDAQRIILCRNETRSSVFQPVVKIEAALIAIPIRKLNSTIRTQSSRTHSSMGFHGLVVEDLQDWKGVET